MADETVSQTATPTADDPDAIVAAPAAITCRSCAAQLDSVQRYCLSCGTPVPGMAPKLDASLREQTVVTAAVAAPARSQGPLRPLAALGAATLAGAMVTLLLMSALAGKVDQPITVNVPAGKAPVVNVASGTGQPVPEAAFSSDWSSGNAWTVQLQSLPKASTSVAAVSAAKMAATAAGASAVGALDSDAHPSLESGQYVVYSGVFKTKAKAEAARKRLGSSFAEAKVVRVSNAASATDKATKKKLDDLKSSSGDDYVGKSKQLPDSVQTPGPALPPEDSTSTTPSDSGDVDTIG